MNRYVKSCALLFVGLVLFLPDPAGHAAEQYKKFGNKGISLIVDGKYDAAIKHFEDVLGKYPGDLESLYGLAMAYTQKRDLDDAMKYVKKAVDGGMPFGRFLAGPRDLLEPLTESAAFKAFSHAHPLVGLLHGPMIGTVTDTSSKFWVRTTSEVLVQVWVGKSDKPDSIKSNIAKTSRERDFTAVVTVDGLQPNTSYQYGLLVNGVSLSTKWLFRTFPAQGEKCRFQIGFGGGAGYTPQYEGMWNTITSRHLTAFLFLGDNVYIDNPTRRAVQQYCYYRRQSRPEYRRFIASTAIYAIWDDHDFTINDAGGGPLIDTPAWKIPVWHTYTYNWNNPYYAGGLDQPGCWFDFSIGDVDFFMLDGRFYRDDPKSENPSMLGPAQKKWLFKKLKSSNATFKVLASPVPWSYGAKPGSRDPWQGYMGEREQIFSFLEANKIDGVILIAADRHRSDAWRIERELDDAMKYV
ncbi:alkaline phosphatase D family protein, partial [Planctomycetota bacterium]